MGIRRGKGRRTRKNKKGKKKNIRKADDVTGQSLSHKT